MAAVTEVNRTLRVLSGRTPESTMPVIVTGLVRPGVDSFYPIRMSREDWARPLGLANLRESGVPADAVGFLDGVPVVIFANNKGPVRVFAVLLAVDHPAARDSLHEVVFVADMSRATGAELLRPLAELFSVPKAERSARATHRLAAFVFSGPVARCVAVVMEGAHAEMVEGPTYWSTSMSTSGTWPQQTSSSSSSSSSFPFTAPAHQHNPVQVSLEALNSTSLFSEGMQSDVVARTRALAALKPEELGPESSEAHRVRIVQESKEARLGAIRDTANSLSPSKNPISPSKRHQPLPSAVIGQRSELLRKFDRAVTPDQKRALAHEAAAFEESVYHSFEQAQQPPPPKSPVAASQGARLNLSNVEHPRGPSVSMLEAHSSHHHQNHHVVSAVAAPAQANLLDVSVVTPPLGHSEDAMKRYSLEPTFNIHGMHRHRNQPPPMHQPQMPMPQPLPQPQPHHHQHHPQQYHQPQMYHHPHPHHNQMMAMSRQPQFQTHHQQMFRPF
jgi:hypothetical protein